MERRKKGEGLKETDSGVYSKELNSQIHSITFKPNNINSITIGKKSNNFFQPYD